MHGRVLWSLVYLAQLGFSSEQSSPHLQSLLELKNILRGLQSIYLGAYFQEGQPLTHKINLLFSFSAY